MKVLDGLVRRRTNPNPRFQRNLRHRLAKPAKGNGRLQKACRRGLWASDGQISLSTATEWAGARRDNVRRALRSIGAVEWGGIWIGMP